jgi:hypothetical protein
MPWLQEEIDDTRQILSGEYGYEADVPVRLNRGNG